MIKRIAVLSFTFLLVMALVPSMTTTAAAAAVQQTPTYTLHDYIGKAWEHEIVTYTLTADQARAIKGLALVDGQGKPVVYQYDDATRTLSFQATVEPMGSSTYSFAKSKPDVQTDLKVVEQGDSIELSNKFTGVRIAKNITGQTTDTPIQAWLLASGKWAGQVRFDKPQQVKTYTAKIVEQGPVRVRVVCDMVFDNGDTWSTSFELLANEPAVLIHETFACSVKRDIVFDFTNNFAAAFVTSRSSAPHPFEGNKYPYGQHIQQDLATRTGRLALVTPWVHWGGNPLACTHFNLLDADAKDMFYLTTRNAQVWVDPSIDGPKRAERHAYLMRSKEGDVTLTYTLAQGQRSYLIGSQNGAEERKIVDEKLIIPGPAQHMQMRHDDYPLDRVKDYVLKWDAPALGVSGLLSPQHVKELLVDYKVDPRTLSTYQKTKPNAFTLEKAIPLYFATHDPLVERQLIDAAVEQIQGYVDQFTELKAQFSVAMAPHMAARFQTVCNLISTIYDSPQMTEAERVKISAQVAFLTYLFNRDSYCSTARGFAGFPNMTACVYANRAAGASVMPGHPMQKQWLNTALADLHREFLDHWVDKDGNYNGSHIESLTYSRFTFDMILGVLYRVYRSGANPEAIFSPAIKQFGEWQANSATPRDERLMGWRHDPPVGNNYYFDVSPAVYAMLAFMWQDRDPEFAGHMKWMQLEQGNKQVQAIGGFSPAFAGYRELFMANNVVPVTPHYVSRVWNETSVILRSHYNDPLENMLYMIAGTGHSHYDQDSGSITMFGKGQIITDDFGYYGHAPASDASMIDSPMAPGGHLMKIDKFEANDTVDYVRGSKKLWTRRIQHVKSTDPKGPNYFVVHDGMTMTGPATWRMWFVTNNLELKDNSATSHGLFNVDTDLFFAGVPTDSSLTKEDMTRSGYGLDTKGKYRKHDNTQTGIIIDSSRFAGLLTLVFPRLKDEAPPKVTTIADGGGFKIVTANATDYVFLANKVIEYKEGELSFKGTAGFVRVTDKDVTLRLNEGGDLSYGKQKIHSDDDGPTRSLSNNLILNGDLSTGEWSILPEKARNRPFPVTLEKGVPPGLENTSTPAGYYQKVEYQGAPARPIYLTQGAAYLDPQKTYRVRMSVYVPTKNRLYFVSYSVDKNRRQVKRENGSVWGWNLHVKGPTDGFQTVETTLGPEGSGALQILQPDTVALTPLAFQLYDGEATFYVNKVEIVPIDLKGADKPEAPAAKTSAE